MHLDDRDPGLGELRRLGPSDQPAAEDDGDVGVDLLVQRPRALVDLEARLLQQCAELRLACSDNPGARYVGYNVDESVRPTAARRPPVT